MRLLFITDLHFGVPTHGAIESFQKFVAANPPDYIVLGGDVTQRAYHSQFMACREFLKTLPCPWICVPGNHDLPAFDLIDRFISPFRLYQQYILHDLNPTFQNDTIALIGLNTARNLPHNGKWEQGSVSKKQLQRVRDYFAAAPRHLLKCVVMHHPVAHGPVKKSALLVHNHKAASAAFQEAGVQLLFTGHFHRTNIERIGNMIVCQAGTSFSSRTRGEDNHFFEIEIGQKQIAFQSWRWVETGRYFDREDAPQILAIQ